MDILERAKGSTAGGGVQGRLLKASTNKSLFLF